LLALDAMVHTVQRQIPADGFFRGMFETALAPDEVVTKVTFGIPDAAAYVKFHNMASRFSIVGVFLARFGNEVRVAITGAAPCVFRQRECEDRLAARFSPEAIEGITVDPRELITDAHGTGEYRADLIPVLVQEAVTRCRATS
jgi:carbon-monoxide dehydrogenase medium subunit